MKYHLNSEYGSVPTNKYGNVNNMKYSSTKYKANNQYKQGLNKHNKIYQNIYQDPVITSLKRDKLKSHYDYWSKYQQKTSLFPQNGMSHKRYLADIQQKIITHNFHYSNNNHLSNNHSKFYSNHSSLYPYTFTEYQRMKQKIQQKRNAQQKWLENQIQKLKQEDQLVQINKQTIKNHKTSYQPLKIEQNKRIKDTFKQINDQIKKSKNKTNPKDSSGSSGPNSDSKSKIIKNKSKQKSKIIKPVMQKKFIFNPQKYKLLKFIPDNEDSIHSTDRYKYALQTPYYQNNRMLRSQYLNRYDYLNDKIKQKSYIGGKQKIVKQINEDMIDTAFVFDQLKQCQSDYQQDQKQQINQQQINQQQIKQKNKIRSKQQNLNKLHELLHRTPQKQKNQSSSANNNSNKYNNLSDIKHQRRYAQLLASIQRNQLRNKSLKRKTYNKYLIYKSDHGKQLNSSIKQSPQNQYQYYPKLQNNSINMEISHHGQHYPVFSPYRDHKHLPLGQSDYFMPKSEGRKPMKHYGAYQNKKQSQSHKNHFNVKDLIVDQIQKKKILMKLQQQVHNNQPQKIQHHHIQKQRQEHIEAHYVGKTHHGPKVQNFSTGSHNINNNNYIPHPYTGSQMIANNLKIQFQILKQQLEDKNRKVVDLQLELMQLKNGFNQKKQDNQDISTTAQSKLPNQDRRKDVIIFEDQQCQTIGQSKTMRFVPHLISERISPDQGIRNKMQEQLRKSRNKVLRLEQKLVVQQQAMTNLFEDIGMYQQMNEQLQVRIKKLQRQKSQNGIDAKTSK